VLDREASTWMGLNVVNGVDGLANEDNQDRTERNTELAGVIERQPARTGKRPGICGLVVRELIHNSRRRGLREVYYSGPVNVRRGW
jgi:hypothetical protein